MTTNEKDEQRPGADEIAAAWARELPDTPVGSIEVITPLWQAAKLLADDRRRTLARLGIDDANLDLLSTLRRAGPPYCLSTRVLAQRCLVTAGAISQRVARAEGEGLVTRSPHPGGGRTVMVTLTEAGHRRIEPAVRALLQHEEEHVGVLSPAERREFSRMLATLVRALG